jgi:hypothetical protein
MSSGAASWAVGSAEAGIGAGSDGENRSRDVGESDGTGSDFFSSAGVGFCTKLGTFGFKSLRREFVESDDLTTFSFPSPFKKSNARSGCSLGARPGISFAAGLADSESGAEA